MYFISAIVEKLSSVSQDQKIKRSSLRLRKQFSFTNNLKKLVEFSIFFHFLGRSHSAEKKRKRPSMFAIRFFASKIEGGDCSFKNQMKNRKVQTKKKTKWKSLVCILYVCKYKNCWFRVSPAFTDPASQTSPPEQEIHIYHWSKWK